MIPERLGGGCFLAVVTDAVIHLFRRIACQLVHRGLEGKWRGGGMQLHRKWEGKCERAVGKRRRLCL